MKKTTVIIAIFSILLLAASCGKKAVVDQNQPQGLTEQQRQQQQQKQQEIVSGTQSATSSNPAPNGQAQTIQGAQGKDYTPGRTNASPTVTQTVEGSNLNKPYYEFSEGQTALDILKSSHTVTTKEYSGIGEFVESIDGMVPNSKQFWAFYVNGKSSNVGASSYKLVNGDIIEWKLEAIR